MEKKPTTAPIIERLTETQPGEALPDCGDEYGKRATAMFGRPYQEDWKLNAACRGLQTDDFYERGNHDLAKRYCARCPVWGDCLRQAFQFERLDTVAGIAGGLSPADRERVIDAVRQGEYNKAAQTIIAVRRALYPIPRK